MTLQGALDTGSCTFFLPAGEQMACKIQFGTVRVVTAQRLVLPANIFKPSTLAGARQELGRHWDRVIGYGDGGPRAVRSVVPEADARAQWKRWRKTHGKAYATAAEEDARYRHFKRSLRQIQELRVAHPEARFGLNEHAP